MMYGALSLLLVLAVIFIQPASSYMSSSSSPAAALTSSPAAALNTRFRLQSANAVSGSSSGSKKSLLIWDCDGVLVDSEALLKQGEVEALAKAGITLSIGTLNALCCRCPVHLATLLASS
jgi:hypothetical protein